jgi:hypothetical protein
MALKKGTTKSMKPHTDINTVKSPFGYFVPIFNLICPEELELQELAVPLVRYSAGRIYGEFPVIATPADATGYGLACKGLILAVGWPWKLQHKEKEERVVAWVSEQWLMPSLEPVLRLGAELADVKVLRTRNFDQALRWHAGLLYDAGITATTTALAKAAIQTKPHSKKEPVRINLPPTKTPTMKALNTQIL